VNDFIRRPLDRNELLARVRTQVKRKRYNMELRKSVEQTLEMAVSDSLTGLYNRRYLDNHLPGMVEKAVGRNSPLSLIMCDIDHFKAVNDTFGHDIGDEVIREFAKRLCKNIRVIDLACRYGGEEFVVVMPDTDTALAEVAAERIRAEVAQHLFVVAEGREQLSVTVSMGIASMTDAGDTPGKLIKRADIALYNAKRGGRNTVTVEAA
jgi:two-component system cell cycle response regulator